MKKILLASIAASAILAASARAADMPVKAPPIAAAPVFSWTGCYAGIEGGGAWGRMKQVESDSASPLFGQTEAHPHVDGGLVGGTLGCNYQTGNFVWSVEGDLSWAHIRGRENDLPPFNTAFINGLKINSFDTLRGRVGYAMDRSLWYVTGGGAFARTVATQFPGGPPEIDITQNRSGGLIGGGVEWVFADPRWSVKAEYLYVHFGKKNIDALDHTIQLNENIVRIGLNYRFGDWGKSPVVAKY